MPRCFWAWRKLLLPCQFWLWRLGLCLPVGQSRFPGRRKTPPPWWVLHQLWLVHWQLFSSSSARSSSCWSWALSVLMWSPADWSLLRPLGKDLSLFLDPLSGTHYLYPSEKHSVLQLLKQNLRLIFFTLICPEVQVLVSVCSTQEVCVCVCVSLAIYGLGYFSVRWYGVWILCVLFFYA